MDSRAQCTREQFRNFWWDVWPEAVRDFERCGIQLETTDITGEVRRTASDRPVFVGVQRGVVNLVLTDHIPLHWDNGRSSSGVTALYDGYHICMLALRYAHAHQIPFLSVNTCVHELLHVLTQDIFVQRPKWYQAGEHEFRVDLFATRLWLFRDGSAIREAAQRYLDRLRSESR